VSASWAIAGTSPFSSNLISIYLTPSFPLSFKGKGGRFCEEGLAPLLNSPYPLYVFVNLIPFIPLSLTRRGGRDFREGRSPSLTFTPPSLKEVDEVLA